MPKDLGLSLDTSLAQKLLCLFIASYRLFSTRGDQESVDLQRRNWLLAKHQSKSNSQTQGWQTEAHQQEAERTGYRERSPGSIDCCVHHSKNHSSDWQQVLQQVPYATEKELQKWQRLPAIAMTMKNACWVDIRMLLGERIRVPTTGQSPNFIQLLCPGHLPWVCAERVPFSTATACNPTTRRAALNVTWVTVGARSPSSVVGRRLCDDEAGHGELIVESELGKPWQARPGTCHD
jgi:hypothetical protein